MIRFLYNLLWPIGLLFFLPGYLVKMFRRGGYRNKFGQRLGFYSRDVVTRLAAKRPIWLHAVSVGEVAIALKLARAILHLRADAQFALTTTTTTGFAFANRNALRSMEVMYSPLDFWPIMRRAFNAIRPERIVLIEAEVWPNLAAIARASGASLALANARLSPHSEPRFNRFRWIAAPIFRQLDLVCVPEPADVDRWSAIGVDRSRIHYTGSIKFDPEERDSVRDPGPVSAFHLSSANPDQLVVFGGSTHRGEEEVLGRIFLALRKEFPNLWLFIAPRHTERAREIQKQLAGMGLEVKLLSEAEKFPTTRPDCVLLDRTGELQRWYALATVVFVGKSLSTRGGQNPVEPIVAGKPVVFGSHMENFLTLARELVANGGAIEVSDEGSLAKAVRRLLIDTEDGRRLVENGRRIIESHRGATMRTAQLVLNLEGGAPATPSWA